MRAEGFLTVGLGGTQKLELIQCVCDRIHLAAFGLCSSQIEVQLKFKFKFEFIGSDMF